MFGHKRQIEDMERRLLRVEKLAENATGLLGALVDGQDDMKVQMEKLTETTAQVIEGASRRLEDLDNRLKNLEGSDFARNRSDYDRTMTNLSEGMPEVSMHE